MKPINAKKQPLQLGKKTITQFDRPHMDQIKGGAHSDQCKYRWELTTQISTSIVIQF